MCLKKSKNEHNSTEWIYGERSVTTFTVLNETILFTVQVARIPVNLTRHFTVCKPHHPLLSREWDKLKLIRHTLTYKFSFVLQRYVRISTLTTTMQQSCDGDIASLPCVRVCVLCVSCVCVCVCVREPCEQDRRQSYHHRSIKPSTNVPHWERMNPIDFQGQGSNVKVTMDLTLKTLWTG